MKKIAAVLVLTAVLLMSVAVTAFAAPANQPWYWPIPSSTKVTWAYNGSSHLGVDIGAALGAPIYAPTDGTLYKVYTGCTRYGGLGTPCKTVGKCNPNHGYTSSSTATTYGYCNNGYGNGVCIKTSDGYYIQFAHMQSVASGIVEGNKITRGTLLGYIGGSGYATGKHSHYQIGKSEFGSTINPMSLTYADSPTISVSFSDDTTDTSRRTIANTTATMASTITVSGTSISSVTKVGFHLYDWNYNLLKSKEETPQSKNGVINAWYIIKPGSTDINYTLSPGTTYHYRFHCIIGGKTYYGDYKSFTTTGTSTFTINFNANGGSCSTTSKTATVNQQIGTLPTPTRTGYKFDGWFTTTDGREVTSTYMQGNSAALALIAHWTAIPVSGITLNPSEMTMVSGESATISATVSPSNALNKTVNWTSSNTAVATVANGVVTAKEPGTAVITAAAADGSGIKTMCSITVNAAVDSLEFNRYSVKLSSSGIGREYRIVPMVTPADAVYNITYTSANESIARVSADGLITAVSNGTTMITASIAYGPEATLSVTVSDMGLISLPADMTAINEEAFCGDTFERAAIAPGTEFIGSRAFADNRNLRFVLIPNSVSYISDDAFDGDPNLVILCGSDSYARTWAIDNGKEYLQDETAAYVPVRSIVVPGNMSFEVDNEISLAASVKPINATNTEIHWTSGNSNVASVTSDGILTTLAEGTAVITATSVADGVSASFTVTVVLPDIAMTFEADETNTMIGIDDASFVAYITADGTEIGKVASVGAILYAANGAELSRVTEAPQLTADSAYISVNVESDLGISLKPSTQYRYAFFAEVYGKTFISDQYTFTTGVAVPMLHLPADTLSMKVGDTYVLTPTVKYTDNTNTTVMWQTNKSTVVRVSNGTLTAVSAGTAVITAILAEDSSVRASCTVTVSENVVKVSSITLSADAVTLNVGNTRSLTAVVSPSNAANRGLTWSSSNTACATVDAQGVITAKAAGTAVITASAADGSGTTATCDVTVKGTVSVTYTAYSSKESITSTNAVVAKTINVSGAAAISDVTYVGCYLYDANGKVLGSKREAPVPKDGVINAWYNVNTELGVTLTAGTSYRYRFVVVIDGTDYYSGYYTFTTAAAPSVTVKYSSNSHQSFASNSTIVLARTISVSGAATISDVTKVGCYLYNAAGTQLAYKRETPTPKDGVINAWYDIAKELSYTVSASQTYQYRFVAVVNGKDYWSDMASFVTQPASTGVTVTFGSNSHQSIGSTSATVARTISVSGASISDVTAVGCYIYDANGAQLGYKREKPTPVSGMINAWYNVKTELGVSPVPGITYKYRFVAVVNGQDYYSAYDTFTVKKMTANNAKVQAVIDRAYAWVNYTWTAPVDIPVYNNVYNNTGSAYTKYYKTEYYFKKGTTMKGLPYTLGSSKYNLEKYAKLSNDNKAAASTFTYSGVLMWGPKYGADCSELVSDCLYYGDPAIGTNGQTHFTSDKAYLYEAIPWNDVAPGDALGISGHTMIVVAVNGDNITTIEQCGNGSSSGALHCSNPTPRAAGGYYVCGTCSACAGSKKGATVLTTRDKSKLSGYTVYRYLPLYN